MPYHYIAHRGNVNGPIPERENDPAYIQEALDQGYDVEIDVWMIDGALFLGHDSAQYPIEASFLFDHKDQLWCHAKNEAALFYLIRNRDYFHTFSHDADPHVLTSRGIIWAYVGKPIDKNTVCVMPEQAKTSYSDQELEDAYGICSDFVKMYKTNFNAN